MLEHANGHRPLYHAMLGRKSGAFVMKRVHELIAELVYDDLESFGYRRSSEWRDLAAQYVAGAFMAVLCRWLEQNAGRPAREVDVIFRRLVFHGLVRELTPRR